MPKSTLRAIIVLSVLLLLGAACGDDDGAEVREVGNGTGTASGTGTGGGTATATGSPAAGECVPVGDPAAADTEVEVELAEFSVSVEGEVPAGTVALEARNIGAEPHELVIVRSNSVEALPTDDNGALDEAVLPAGALVGEIEVFPAGEDCTGVFDLEPDTYVFLCNITESEDGEIEAHLAEGMATTVTVG